jgi:hypothetical protein
MIQIYPRSGRDHEGSVWVVAKQEFGLWLGELSEFVKVAPVKLS